MHRLGHHLDARRDELRDERDVSLEYGARGRIGSRGRAFGRGRALCATAAGERGGGEQQEDGGTRHAPAAYARSAIMARVRRTIPLAFLLVVAGCSSGSKHDSQQSASPAVPWTGAIPAPIAERSPVARACRAGDLEVLGQVKFVPRLEGGIALPTIRNTSAHACRLT